MQTIRGESICINKDKDLYLLNMFAKVNAINSNTNEYMYKSNAALVSETKLDCAKMVFSLPGMRFMQKNTN